MSLQPGQAIGWRSALSAAFTGKLFDGDELARGWGKFSVPDYGRAAPTDKRLLDSDRSR
jgi:hypothetical protein